MANISTILFESLTTSSVTPKGVLISFPYYSEKAQAAGYYSQTHPWNSVQFSTMSGFIGFIKLQGSLATEPKDKDWYDIVGMSLGDGINPVTDGTVILDFNGNHVWVRAVIVVFTAGAINKVLFNHN